MAHPSLFPLSTSGYLNLDDRSAPPSPLSSQHHFPLPAHGSPRSPSSPSFPPGGFLASDPLRLSPTTTRTPREYAEGVARGEIGNDYGPYSPRSSPRASPDLRGRQGNPFYDDGTSSRSSSPGRVAAFAAHHEVPRSPTLGASEIKASSGPRKYAPVLGGGAAYSAKEQALDDLLHTYSPADRLAGGGTFRAFSLRGWLNFVAVVAIAVGLVGVFAGYPIADWARKHSAPGYNAFSLGGALSNGTGQIPVIPNLPGLIDADTPDEFMTRIGNDGHKYQLVFSDEVRRLALLVLLPDLPLFHFLHELDLELQLSLLVSGDADASCALAVQRRRAHLLAGRRPCVPPPALLALLSHALTLPSSLASSPLSAAFWEAVDLHYWPTDDLEWYDPDAATTKNGSLVFTMTEEKINGLNYRSGMLQSWNKFCFTGGYIEVRPLRPLVRLFVAGEPDPLLILLAQVSISLPGVGDISGFWPGAWTIGNLARAGASRSVSPVVVASLNLPPPARRLRRDDRRHLALVRSLPPYLLLPADDAHADSVHLQLVRHVRHRHLAEPDLRRRLRPARRAQHLGHQHGPLVPAWAASLVRPLSLADLLALGRVTDAGLLVADRARAPPTRLSIQVPRSRRVAARPRSTSSRRACCSLSPRREGSSS